MSDYRFGSDDYHLNVIGDTWDGISDDFTKAHGVEIDGNEFLRVVRCADCAHAEAFVSGRIVCHRLSQFPHYVDGAFFCAAGRRKETA